MKKIKRLRLLLILFAGLFFAGQAEACSMYKVTKNGKTMAGSNYDAYYLTARIWFEKATKTGEYGAAFSGGRLDGKNGFAPQSGMNEAGLAFSRAAIAGRMLQAMPGKKRITNFTKFMKTIMHSCKTVDEVKAIFSQYDHTFYSNDVFLYTDKAGKYLIVEPDTLIMGSEPKYLLSNFCPSITKEEDALKMAKYRKGVEFTRNKLDSNLAFCTALSDTMHVCREKIGDGTLLTCIADVSNGQLYYYFYHDFQHPIKFNLKAELAKGNHMYKVPELFPKNAEYEKLVAFKTPQNTDSLMAFLLVCAGVFFISAMFFFIRFFWKRNTQKYAWLNLLLVLLGLFTSFYMLILARNETIFYFPAPYKDYKFSILDIAAYIPFLILLAIIPLFRMNLKIFKEKVWRTFPKWLFTLNNLTYLILIVLFGYWGLFNVFS